MARYTAEEVAAYRAEMLEQIDARLQASVERLVTGDDWLAAIRFAARFRSRSWMNTLLLASQHAEAFEAGRVPDTFPTYVAGRVQWRALGRWPTQPGYVIRQPVLGRIASATPEVPGSWRPLPRGQRPKPGETVRRRMLGTRPAKVWDVSMTEGEPVPRRPEPLILVGTAPAALLEAVQDCIRAAGYTIATAPGPAALGGANGVTDFRARTVTVRGDMSDAAILKTTLHELAHTALHDPASATTRAEHAGIGEVKAESVAAFIAASYGLDTDDYTIPYVAGWASSVPDKTVPEVLRDVAEHSRATALTLLQQLPDPPTSDGYPPGMRTALDARDPALNPAPELDEPATTAPTLER